MDPGQPMVSLGTLGGNESAALCINSAGQVAWWAETGDGKTPAFLKDPGQPMTNLGTMGGSVATAFGINDAGQVVGEAADSANEARAFLKNPGENMQDLGDLGGTWNRANDINSYGQVVGFAEDNGGTLHAFIWENGVMQKLEDLTINLPPGVILLEGRAINDNGWIVGRDYNGHAFLLTPAPTGAAGYVPLGLLLN